MSYQVLSFYLFAPVPLPQAEVERWRLFLSSLEARGRIYISEEGVNAQFSIKKAQLDLIEQWLKAHYGEKISLKIQGHNAHAFAGLVVKYRKQLVALDRKVDLRKTGHYLTPAEWKAALEGERDFLLLDVRNHYEYVIGHFVGAEDPGLESFREFPSYLEKLKKRVAKDQKILMACTGGIRCELFSSLMVEEGFEKVYQLQGGIIAYGNEIGSSHWEGKLFVFDDRMAVALDAQEKPAAIGSCHFCNQKADTYYNCANMECNTLFLACSSCYVHQKGCCTASCTEAPRVRKVEGESNVPFRKWYHYFSQKKALAAEGKEV